MQKLIIGLLAGILLLASCKENHDLVTKTTYVPPSDTTYMAGLDSTQQHNLLFEEFTGASCPNCPTGHKVLDTQSQIYSTRLNIIALHVHNNGDANPALGHIYDFRTVWSDQIASNVYDGSPYGTLPSGGTDRFAFSGNKNITYSSLWGTAIAAKINDATSPVHLYVSSTFNTSDSTATIHVFIKYVKNITSGQFLSIALVEDGLIDVQKDGAHYDSGYVFNNVLRDFVTQGDKMGQDAILHGYSSIAAGRVDERYYYYKPTIGDPDDNNAAKVAGNCRLVAFVVDSTSGAVYQSAQCKLVGP